jgi:hypothetical protein
MPSIKSELTNKTLPGGAKMRSYTVPDAGAPTPQPEPENPAGLDFGAVNASMVERGLPPLDPETISAWNTQQMAKRTQSPQDLEQLEKQISQARKDKVMGVQRLSQVAKQRIEMLCGISRGIREVDLDGRIFVLRTLKGKEQRLAIMAAAEYDGTIQSPFEIRRQLLARAIDRVDGTDFDLFLNDTSMEARLDAVEELEEAMLIKLYDEYLSLVRETQDRYFPKNEVEAKEVVADLGK